MENNIGNMFTQLSENLKTVFEVHPPLCNNRHPMDGVLVGAGSTVALLIPPKEKQQTKNKFRNALQI
jgi:hypothetical protein